MTSAPAVVVLDLETTGLSVERGDRIVEVGLVRLGSDLRIEREYTTLVNPEREMGAMSIHGIRGIDVADAPTFADIAADVGEFLGGAIIAAHNAPFDIGFLVSELQQVGLDERIPPNVLPTIVDTVEVSRRFFEGLPNYKLPTVCAACEVPDWSQHGALEDARATARLLARLDELSGGLLARDLFKGSVVLEPGWTGRKPSGRSTPRKTLATLAKRMGSTPVPTTKAPPLQGEIAVFTGGIGIARDEAIRAAEMLGCEVRPGVTKKTSIVVVGDPDVGRMFGRGAGITGKHRKALDLAESGQRLRILTESEFMRLAEVVSDETITDDEWITVRELIYSGGFAATCAGTPSRPRRRMVTEESELEDELPSNGAPPRKWRSLAFLQTSDAASPRHAIELIQQFIAAFKADIVGFSGKHEMIELEEFVRTLGTAPGVARSFLDRSPGMVQFAPKLTAAIAEMACDAVEQTRNQLERADAATAADPGTVSALKAAREVEQALRA